MPKSRRLKSNCPCCGRCGRARSSAVGTCTAATAPTATKAPRRNTHPFNHLQDPDPTTRAHLVHLAHVITGTCGAGQNAYVTINNKAEGCAPLSVVELGNKVAA